jgi:aldehyde:ferredoxin oxidoreductase
VNPLGNVLYVNLEEQVHEIVEAPDLFEKYLGGSGLAIELLLKECPSGTDALAPENPVVLAPGPLGGLFPSAGKTVAAFKSPVTGNLGESHAGGRLAVSLRLAGYGALVIRSAASSPTSVEINSDGVRFRSALPLKGFSSLEVERRLRGCASCVRMQSIASIGSAGENKVAYACVNVDRYNFFGRLGLGAVFGAKNLKSISIVGAGSIGVSNVEVFKKTFKKLYSEEVETDKMAKYHYTGTPANVLVLNEIGALPTKNFQLGRFDHADAISGETLGNDWLERKVSCPSCPVGCMHVARLRPAFAKGFEYEPVDVYHNYESVYALGSNLLVKSAEEVLRLNHQANVLGLDTMLLGNILAWATEAYDRGIINQSHTGGVTPRWGDTDAYLVMMEKIALRSNSFYDTLGQGLDRAAETYGGEEFAMSLGGNGPAGYHTGYASLLGTVTGARHSHNSNAGYDIDQRMLHQKLDADRVLEELRKENEWRYVLTSLVVCLFARRIYTQRRVVEALKAVGIERSVKELERLGANVYKRAFEFKFREGFAFDKLKLPRRMFESATANGKLDEAVFRSMLDRYVRTEFGQNSTIGPSAAKVA